MELYGESSLAFDELSEDDTFQEPIHTLTVPKYTGRSRPREVKFTERPTVDWFGKRYSNQLDGTSKVSSNREKNFIVYTTHDRENPTADKIRAYLKRVSDLRTWIAQEGSVLNRESERDFWNFVISEPNVKRGDLVATPGGNLRIVWKDSRGSHLGLQFLGGDRVQYVIFKRRPATQMISRVSGRDSIEGVKHQSHSFELETLLNE